MGSSVRHRIAICVQLLLLHKRLAPDDFPMQADEYLGYTHLVEGSGSILQTNEELDVIIKFIVFVASIDSLLRRPQYSRNFFALRKQDHAIQLLCSTSLGYDISLQKNSFGCSSSQLSIADLCGLPQLPENRNIDS
jgi:hypothetical protein